MAIPVHPHVQRRDSGLPPSLVHVLVHARSPVRASWIDAELTDRSVVVQNAHSVGQIISALIEDPPPRPQLLVLDFDHLDDGDLTHFHALRRRGWFGRIIALGRVPLSLRTSLAIERVIDEPFRRDALRAVIAHESFVASTKRMAIP